ncbi:MAG: Gfo/Idh/MocA family oxidoreductase [Alkalinema sp. RU_4_3]|nr:Gfo/Idh/MocA family oxidoreductase [Alkalinema sp. RU_4_3]
MPFAEPLVSSGLTTATATTGVAILGLGRWGVHWLRNFRQHSQARVVALCDPHGPNLDRAIASFERPEPVFTTTDWRSAIAHPEVEAVIIVTPASTHAEVVAAALDRHLHVLVEKPLTLTVESAYDLCAKAEQVDRQLMVDHNYLFHPAVIAGREAVASLGNLRYGYATRSHLGPVRGDVDVMWDLAIHDVAILNHWLGMMPEAVVAEGQSWLQVGIADNVWARLIYPGGLEMRMHWAWNNPDKQRRCGLVGDRGTLIFDELATNPLVIQKGTFGINFQPEQVGTEVLAVPQAEPLAAVCDHFLRSVRSNSPSSVSSGWVGLELVRVLVGLKRSMDLRGARIEL